MKNLFVAITILLTFASCSTVRETDFTTSWDTLRVLNNPDKGWYHHLLDNGVDAYAIRNDSIFASFPGMDHLYLRLAWSYLEPAEGKYDWHRIDEVIEKYMPLGYKISFRISSKETGAYPGAVGQQLNGVHYATPVWVQKAGAKGTVAEVWNTKSWTPDWDDPVYLEKLDNFQRAFAARYDGKPYVSYIDIGSIGEWGEGHTHFSTRVPPTVEEVKASIDVFVKNFKKSQLVCTDDLLYYGKDSADVKILLDYAISNGVSLRDDSPLVNWYLDHNLNTWSVSHPHFYDPLYKTKPIVFELQHYREVKRDSNWLGKNGSDTIPKYGYSGAHIMRKAIETMHATYIGFHGYAEDWLADNPDLTNELANLCGYWYFPEKATFPKKLKNGENTISISWLNKGVAPAYKEFGIVFRLESKKGDVVIDFPIDNSGNRDWMPGIVSTQNYTLLLTDKTKAEYILKFRLVLKTEDNARGIDIGLSKSLIDKDGFVELGEVRM